MIQHTINSINAIYVNYLHIIFRQQHNSTSANFKDIKTHLWTWQTYLQSLHNGFQPSFTIFEIYFNN